MCRIAVLEDRQQIARLISSYGPAVDSGSPAAIAALWTASGSYAYSTEDDKLAVLSGRQAFGGHGPWRPSPVDHQ